MRVYSEWRSSVRFWMILDMSSIWAAPKLRKLGVGVVGTSLVNAVTNTMYAPCWDGAWLRTVWNREGRSGRWSGCSCNSKRNAREIRVPCSQNAQRNPCSRDTLGARSVAVCVLLLKPDVPSHFESEWRNWRRVHWEGQMQHTSQLRRVQHSWHLWNRTKIASSIPISRHWETVPISNRLIPGLTPGNRTEEDRLVWNYAQEVQ